MSNDIHNYSGFIRCTDWHLSLHDKRPNKWLAGVLEFFYYRYYILDVQRRDYTVGTVRYSRSLVVPRRINTIKRSFVEKEAFPFVTTSRTAT